MIFSGGQKNPLHERRTTWQLRKRRLQQRRKQQQRKKQRRENKQLVFDKKPCTNPVQGFLFIQTFTILLSFDGLPFQGCGRDFRIPTGRLLFCGLPRFCRLSGFHGLIFSRHMMFHPGLRVEPEPFIGGPFYTDAISRLLTFNPQMPVDFFNHSGIF